MIAKESIKITVGSMEFSFSELTELGLNPLDFADPISFNPADFITVHDDKIKEPKVENRFRLHFPIYSEMLQFLQSVSDLKENIPSKRCSAFIIQMNEFDDNGEFLMANFVMDPDFVRQSIFVSISGGDFFIPKDWKKWKWENKSKKG